MKLLLLNLFVVVAPVMLLDATRQQQFDKLRKHPRDGAREVDVEPRDEQLSEIYLGEFFADAKNRQHVVRKRNIQEQVVPVVTQTIHHMVTVTQTLQSRQPQLQGRNALNDQQTTLVISQCVTKVRYPKTVVETRTVSLPLETVYVEASNFDTVTVTFSKTRHPASNVHTQQLPGNKGYAYAEPNVKFTHGRQRRGLGGGDSLFRRQQLTGFFPERTATVAPHLYSLVSELYEPEGSGEF